LPEEVVDPLYEKYNVGFLRNTYLYIWSNMPFWSVFINMDMHAFANF